MKLLKGRCRSGGSKLVWRGKEEAHKLGEFILLFIIHSFSQEIFIFVQSTKNT